MPDTSKTEEDEFDPQEDPDFKMQEASAELLNKQSELNAEADARWAGDDEEDEDA